MTAATGLGRWLDLQALALGARYRRIETSAGVVASDEGQYSFAVRGRLKLDAAGRFSANVGAATGGLLTSGWNGTGLGSGSFFSTFSVKQLYAGATPFRGLTVDYGGLSVVRGETTEVTNFDNDAYVVGGRATVQRPEIIWVDEATVSLLYVGDPAMPDIFSRLHRLADTNYRQYLVGKKVGKALRVSVAYDRYQRVGTMRAGVVLRSAGAIDLIRFEEYSRLGDGGASGFGIYAEKTVLRRFVLGGGYADIDAGTQIANGDRYLRGRRLYTLDTLRITASLALSVYFTHTVAADFAVANRTRFETVLSYNALGAAKRALHLH